MATSEGAGANAQAVSPDPPSPLRRFADYTTLDAALGALNKHLPPDGRELLGAVLAEKENESRGPSKRRRAALSDAQDKSVLEVAKVLFSEGMRFMPNGGDSDRTTVDFKTRALKLYEDKRGSGPMLSWDTMRPVLAKKLGDKMSSNTCNIRRLLEQNGSMGKKVPLSEKIGASFYSVLHSGLPDEDPRKMAYDQWAQARADPNSSKAVIRDAERDWQLANLQADKDVANAILAEANKDEEFGASFSRVSRRSEPVWEALTYAPGVRAAINFDGTRVVGASASGRGQRMIVEETPFSVGATEFDEAYLLVVIQCHLYGVTWDYLTNKRDGEQARTEALFKMKGRVRRERGDPTLKNVDKTITDWRTDVASENAPPANGGEGESLWG